MEKVVQWLNIDRNAFSKSIRTDEKPTFKSLGIDIRQLLIRMR